ncbi:hypothetical protein [Pelagibius sp. Alg239-R121]|uniref:hypothetical protein n=1 Tax=Pelagibius sp. Alg239-R121 TaxID=2993448 RepID=UPI0024A6A0C1|nr:hypothetical protein [Pelagibius sp. Alg239-R121]
MTQKARSPWRFLILSIAGLSIAWLAAMLYLDIAHEMFPQVLLGGLKILAAGYAVLFILVLPIIVISRLRGRKDKRTDSTPVA